MKNPFKRDNVSGQVPMTKERKAQVDKMVEKIISIRPPIRDDQRGPRDNPTGASPFGRNREQRRLMIKHQKKTVAELNALARAKEAQR